MQYYLLFRRVSLCLSPLSVTPSLPSSSQNNAITLIKCYQTSFAKRPTLKSICDDAHECLAQLLATTSKLKWLLYHFRTRHNGSKKALLFHLFIWFERHVILSISKGASPNYSNSHSVRRTSCNCGGLIWWEITDQSCIDSTYFCDADFCTLVFLGKIWKVIVNEK